MSQAVILVWVSVTTGSAAAHVGALPPVPVPTPHSHTTTTFDYTTSATPSQRRAITAWAQSHLLSIVPPAQDASVASAHYDPELVEQIEELLEQARVSAGSLDEALALEQLANVEAAIYAHPELPQAGLLLAEAAAQQAAIVEQSGQARLAQIQRSRATTLEGTRVRPYAAVAEVHSMSSDASMLAPQAREVAVTGLTQHDDLIWNGSPVSARRLNVPIGEHHVQAIRDDALIWAGFLMVHDTETEIRIPVAPPAPCSKADLAGTGVHHERVVGAERVRCARWAIARPAAGKGVEIALCRQSECGRLMNWQEGFGEPLVRPLHETHPWRLPRWAGYVAAGAGVVLTTGLVLWQTGAFEDPDRQPRSFSFGGIEE